MLSFDEIEDDLKAHIESLAHDKGHNKKNHSPGVNRQQFKEEEEEFSLRFRAAHLKLE